MFADPCSIDFPVLEGLAVILGTRTMYISSFALYSAVDVFMLSLSGCTLVDLIGDKLEPYFNASLPPNTLPICKGERETRTIA